MIGGMLIWLGDGMNFEVIESKRIGVSEDLKEPMRFYIRDNGACE